MLNYRKSSVLFSCLIVLSLLVSACAGVAPAGDATGSGDAAMDAEAMDAAPTYETWDDVLAAAEGTTVNWFMWGGSDTINENVDNDIGGPLLELYNITLNRVRCRTIRRRSSTKCWMSRPQASTRVAVWI